MRGAMVGDRFDETRFGAARLSPERGFTLVELLVATTILVVGLLALVTTSAVVARTSGAGALELVAAVAAESRIESLRAAPCGAASPGSASARGVRESWQAAAGGSVVELADSVSFDAATGGRAFSLRTLARC